MSRDLIGIDGGPLLLQGLALPYRERVVVAGVAEAFRPGAFRRQVEGGAGVPLLWEHEGSPIAEGWRVELIDCDAGLMFSALMPDTPMARYVAAIATGAQLRCSISFRAVTTNGAGDHSFARLEHIGLVGPSSRPVYDTLCWRADASSSQLSPRARSWRIRLNLARANATADGIRAEQHAKRELEERRQRDAARPKPQLAASNTVGFMAYALAHAASRPRVPLVIGIPRLAPTAMQQAVELASSGE